ncbi:MAG: DUF3857 domain-containing protein [Bacteroidota bacterium]
MTVFQLLAYITLAQNGLERFVTFGVFTPEEIALKSVPFEKDADAVIIHHLAKSDFNDQNNLITEHRIKLKILNEKGISNGDVHIRFYHKDDFEFLSGINAVIRTPEENGQSTTTQINRKSIYTIKINDRISETRFAMPNVKTGSIIEYMYTSQMKHYGGLDEWSFQSYLPTITSFYKLSIIQNAEFAFKVYKLPNLPIDIDTKQVGQVSYTMHNIPALQDEAFMDARRDNLQHVSFQLSGINRNGFKEKYINTWDEAAKELLITPELGGQLNKKLSGTDDIISTAKKIGDLTERTKVIYDYLQQKMTWNGNYGKYSIEGIKKAWEKHTGTNSEINMIFVNLLQQADVNACLMMANDRDDGKIDIQYPFIDQFHKLVAYITLPSKPLIVDASDINTPMHLIPLSLLNTYGYKIDKKNKGLLLLSDETSKASNLITIKGTISDEGELHANAIAESKNYCRLERVIKYKSAGTPGFLQNYYTNGYADLNIDSLELINLDNDSLSLLQKMNFTQTLNTSGEFIFVNYHLFSRLIKNPFTNNLRFSDINFGSTLNTIIIQSLQIPANYTAVELPKNSRMETADKSLMFSRFLQLENGLLSMKFQFETTRSFFERDEYEMLKDFYKRMFLLMDQQVILKKK